MNLVFKLYYSWFSFLFLVCVSPIGVGGVGWSGGCQGNRGQRKQVKKNQKKSLTITFDCCSGNVFNVLVFYNTGWILKVMCPFQIQFYPSAVWVPVPVQQFISACWRSILVSEIPIPLYYCYNTRFTEIYLTSGKMSTHCNHVTSFPDLQFISQLG